MDKGIQTRWVSREGQKKAVGRMTPRKWSKACEELVSWYAQASQMTGHSITEARNTSVVNTCVWK